MTESTSTPVIPPGRVQNLTKEQELCLKQVWAYLLQFWGIAVDTSRIFEETRNGVVKTKNSNMESQENNNDNNRSSSNCSEGKRQKILGLFGKKNKEKRDSSSNTLTSPVNTPSPARTAVNTPNSGSDAGLGCDTANDITPLPSMIIHESLVGMDGDEVKEYFWDTVKCDYPDNLLLRFVRARKWDTEKAMEMIGNTLRWRLTEGNPEAIIRGGEVSAYKAGKKGLIKQLELAKATVRGRDKLGNPIVHVRPRLHHASDQTEEEVQEYSLLIIEQARLFLREPQDAATILFDLTGFSMSNMDYGPVKFLISCFEAHYPECLGKLIIHKAPWIFPPIWNIIKNWLDPVVASKIAFTSTTKELQQFFPIEHIPESLGGNDTYDFDGFKAPDGSADEKLKDTKTRSSIMLERKDIINRFIETTVSWIENDSGEKSSALLRKKIELGEELVQNYMKLDPYIRSRSFYDLNGTLKL